MLVPVGRWAGKFVARHHLDPGEIGWLVKTDGEGYVPRERFLTAVRERYCLDETVSVLLCSLWDQIVALTEVDPRVPAALERLRRDGWRMFHTAAQRCGHRLDNRGWMVADHGPPPRSAADRVRLYGWERLIPFTFMPRFARYRT